MSNNKKIYYINTKDNLIYDSEEVKEYIEEALKNLALKNTVFLFDIYFNNHFAPLTAEKEEEILSKNIFYKKYLNDDKIFTYKEAEEEAKKAITLFDCVNKSYENYTELWDNLSNRIKNKIYNIIIKEFAVANITEICEYFAINKNDFKEFVDNNYNKVLNYIKSEIKTSLSPFHFCEILRLRYSPHAIWGNLNKDFQNTLTTRAINSYIYDVFIPVVKK